MAERKWLAAVVISEAKVRVPVIVGVSAENTLDAGELTRHADRAGAVAVFATSPPLGAVTLEALRATTGR